jgi:hypothetical protein
MSSVTTGVCRGVFICFSCVHVPSSTVYILYIQDVVSAVS